jgi:hypothetical protein
VVTDGEPKPIGRRPSVVPHARFLALILAAVVLAGCMPSPASSSISSAEAVAAVLAQDPMFTGIESRDPDLIGQASWSEASETDDGWEIVIRIGWGDCPAGCISEHTWTYAVSPTGDVTLVDESGAPLPADSGLRGMVVAGPTCPVVSDPPDPSCEDRPVEGAELVVTTPEGTEVARATSDAEGAFAIALAPGAYRLVPQPVVGLMGTAEPMEVSVEWGMLIPELIVTYDTGIR